MKNQESEANNDKRQWRLSPVTLLGRWWTVILSIIVLTAIYWKANVTITINNERTHKDAEAWLWRFDVKAP
jgi:hypothetical protein